MIALLSEFLEITLLDFPIKPAVSVGYKRVFGTLQPSTAKCHQARDTMQIRKKMLAYHQHEVGR